MDSVMAGTVTAEESELAEFILDS